jgi:hypothetical protein
MASFCRKTAKMAGFGAKNGGLLGFVFTDKYTWMIDENVYYLSLAWMYRSQESGFEGGGVVSPLFFFPF